MSKNNDKGARRLRITVLDDATHDRLKVFHTTRGGLIAGAVAAVIAILLIGAAILAFTPLKKLIPGYPDEYSRQMAVRNAIRIDSLENEIMKCDIYTTNLRLVLSSEEPLPLDSLLLSPSELSSEDLEALKASDEKLRAEVLEAERFDISGRDRNLPLEGIDFFSPLKGEVTVPFDASRHPMVEIEAEEGAMVMAVLDGTVLYSGFDPEEGYTIIIAHKGDIMSVYRYNASALKTPGTKVKAGTPIATVGGARPLSAAPGLGFELWSGGERVDPSKYITF